MRGYHNTDQAKPPKTATAAAILDAQMREPLWVIPGILPEGVTFLAGKPKLGKSWMALGFGVAVATGGVALGTKEVKQAEALYLALEDNPRRIKKRLKKVLTPGVRPEGLHIATRWRRSDEGGIADLEAWLDEHAACNLIVIDTLKMFRPRSKGNRGIYDVDYEAVEPLLKLAHRRGVGILIVHHLRKLEAGDPLDMISGSTGLTGGVDGAMVLKRDRGKQDATLHIDGRDIEEPAELALRWDADIAAWKLMGDAQEYRLSEARREIADELRRTGRHMSAKEISDALGKDAAAVRQTLRRMYNDGQVSQDGDGKYYIDDGNPTRDITTHSSHSSHSTNGSRDSHDGVTGVTAVTGTTPVTGVTGAVQERPQPSVKDDSQASFSGERDSQQSCAEAKLERTAREEKAAIVGEGSAPTTSSASGTKGDRPYAKGEVVELPHDNHSSSSAARSALVATLVREQNDEVGEDLGQTSTSALGTNGHRPNAESIVVKPPSGNNSFSPAERSDPSGTLVREQNDVVNKLLGDPPGWLGRQLPLCRTEPERFLGSTASSIAAVALGSPMRWREVLPVLEEYIQK